MNSTSSSSDERNRSEPTYFLAMHSLYVPQNVANLPLFVLINEPPDTNAQCMIAKNRIGDLVIKSRSKTYE
jgi:hypothetical protein